MRKLFSIMFCVVVLLFGSAAVTSAQQAKTWDLGDYPGGTWVNPNTISNLGVVVGYGDIPPNGYTHPLGVPLFGPNAGKWFDLGTLGGEGYDGIGGNIQATAVANDGMIVGFAWITGNPYVQAFAWTPMSGMTDLGGLGPNGTLASFANNINKSGTLIVGTAYDSNGNGFGVVWTPHVVWKKGGPAITWQIQELPTESGTIISGISYWAVGVNNSGQIVGGTYDQSTGAETTVIWNPAPGGKWKIASLPLSSDYPFGNVNNINDNGEVVGLVWALSGPPYLLSAVWKKMDPRQDTWKLILLPALPGSPYTYAEGINDRGDITGYSYDANWFPHGLSWNTKNISTYQLLDFPDSGSPGAWCAGMGVNDEGIAVGVFGNDATPENRGFAVQLRH